MSDDSKTQHRLNVLTSVRNPRCTQCALYASSVNRCVMGNGSPISRVMLIGEAPGEAEAETGQPFMGKSGQLLRKVLADLEMDDVYITNVCKCRPPKNRTPTMKEMLKCSGMYLASEISTVKPKIIVLLGKTAIKWAFGKRPFERGPIFRPPSFGGIGLVCTWHPSYALRLGGGATKTGRDIIKQITKALVLAKETAHVKR